ncbi:MULTISPECIES: uberolysin/carnocyclin family circular bacteriocin [Staphylococcus]|uniref:uberolysin/carnocyclin family circular bacteriocin n=1 Tax=Staphylococcus TaxID=1279 RepID=UPI00209208C6|nr:MULTISPECIES: uberolysin/carnocyclin family circular bacteriocin [Staphylococcus]MCO6330801.1 uberolysin/carnocyclin family circular bacteriocin [Staphylococcus epidermidis]MEB7367627.1 uberolysin/carnocyclin family circular bacteriocin [Staphylococcus borealis]
MVNTKSLFKYGMIFVAASLLVVLFGTLTGDISGASSSSMEFANFATKVGVSDATAGKVIDLVSAGSTVASIVSAVAGVTGAGLIAAGGIQTVKYMIKKKGKDKAAAW